jgi:SRSO17 transposase
MAGASIETTLELWASSLRDVKARIRPLFTQERVAASAGLFLDGVLGDERRKTAWSWQARRRDAGAGGLRPRLCQRGRLPKERRIAKRA